MQQPPRPTRHPQSNRGTPIQACRLLLTPLLLHACSNSSCSGPLTESLVTQRISQLKCALHNMFARAAKEYLQHMQAHMEVDVEDEGVRRGVTGGSDDEEGAPGKDKLGDLLKRDTAEVRVGNGAVNAVHFCFNIPAHLVCRLW